MLIINFRILQDPSGDSSSSATLTASPNVYSMADTSSSRTTETAKESQPEETGYSVQPPRKKLVKNNIKLFSKKSTTINNRELSALLY